MISPKLFSREPPRRTPLFDQKLWVLPKIGGTGSLANCGENILGKKKHGIKPTIMSISCGYFMGNSGNVYHLANQHSYENHHFQEGKHIIY